ncbi:MAG: hypothetical protein P0Y50_01460 [Candidatus Brevundimonas colombiensis]|uniref:Uncharacterized protein n=1 Tax=Candidatus Brevundimonas colombiensis TaxID=3121376 RepID=A0AAJ5X0P4_9CAUL|nr:hypothetical protein [Brevundimonas sp.]WEK40300.1 MAG: hypothetical protein P0Y50_01460 [Brevundimonas sp.]
MALIEKGPFERFVQGLGQGLKTILRPAPRPVLQPFEHPARDVVVRQDGPGPGVWFEVIRRPDGLYSFTEWRRQTVSAPRLGSWEAEFPLFESGLYETRAEAQEGLADYRARNPDEQA